jgi:hypothetical protein
MGPTLTDANRRYAPARWMAMIRSAGASTAASGTSWSSSRWPMPPLDRDHQIPPLAW